MHPQKASKPRPRGAEPNRSRKRVWKQTDPLEFPAKACHWPLFKCNYPFIRKMTELPAYNKYGQLQMNEEVRKQAVKFLSQPYLRKYRMLDSTSELSGCQLHLALFENLWQLTTPSKVLLQKIGRMEISCDLRLKRKRRRVEELRDMMAHKVPKHENVDSTLANVEDDQQSADEEDERESGEEEDEEKQSADLDDERESDEEEDEEKQSADLDAFSESTNESETRPEGADKTGQDFKIWVYNHSNKELQDQFDGSDVDSKKTVCIVECKWDKKERDDAIYQAACYACQEALRNMGNLHFSPLYLIIVCESEWTYGILDPRGTIRVLDGSVDARSYPGFQKQESVRFKSDPTSLESLQGMLNNRTQYYQHHFSRCLDAVYPSGEYLVGKLYVVDEWYKLPAFANPGGGHDYDVHLFYEGLLRVVIGDKVGEWDEDDFERAKTLRQIIMDIDEECFFWE